MLTTSMKRKYTSFTHWPTGKLQELIASPDQRTYVGTDYGNQIGTETINEASTVLWSRYQKATVGVVIAHQAALASWDDYLDAQGVPPIPEAYWARYFALETLNPSQEAL